MRQDDLSALHDFKHLYNWYEHFGEWKARGTRSVHWTACPIRGTGEDTGWRQGSSRFLGGRKIMMTCHPVIGHNIKAIETSFGKSRINAKNISIRLQKFFCSNNVQCLAFAEFLRNHTFLCAQKFQVANSF
jgi:hypothetical protein